MHHPSVLFIAGKMLADRIRHGDRTMFASGAPERTVVPWIVAGLILYALTLAITFIVNVPLNNALVAAGSPDASGDVGAIRTAFEARWVAFNTARAVVGTAAFACLAWGLHVAGHGA